MQLLSCVGGTRRGCNNRRSCVMRREWISRFVSPGSTPIQPPFFLPSHLLTHRSHNKSSFSRLAHTIIATSTGYYLESSIGRKHTKLTMPIPYPRQESLSSSSSTSSESSFDEDEERAMIQEEWEESLRQMEVVMSIIIMPFFGKWFGRQWAYWGMSIQCDQG